MYRRLLSVILLVAILLMGTSGAASQGPIQPSQAIPLSPDTVVTVDGEKPDPRTQAGAVAAAEALGASGLHLASIIVTFEAPPDERTLTAASGGQIIHRYRQVFDGVSMILPSDRVGTVASLPGVTGVYLDELRQVDTEQSPQFIGAPTLWEALGGQGEAGEGVTVGVLDTGIWPEHVSFSDPDPLGNPYDPPQGGPYACDFGNTAWNPNDAPFTCNNKLIGAYSFVDTYKALIGLDPAEFDSARDAEGHGTHTASTAAGNGGVAASIYSIPRGIVSGVAPRAQVIMYRVCGGSGCYASDSVAAVEQAISDGVDVLSYSISGGASPYSDAVSLAFLAAYQNGIFVSCSAGNSGPDPDTVDHREPWVTTVAASNTDRAFISTVTLEAGGDTLSLSGASVTPGITTLTPVILPPAGQELCLTPFPAGTFSGEIVICPRGVIARVAKSFNVAAGGAGGLLLYNPSLQGLATDNHFIPAVHLEYDAGIQLLDFMAAHPGDVQATFTAGTATTVQGDVMAAFSSRGGPGQTLGVSKPDITAPGVQILAGHTPLPAFVDGGLPGELFQSIQGTSMSAPHMAGAAGLLRDLHPDWTPGQVKSALMTTAWTSGVVKEDGVTPADPFDYGSGRVDLSKAGSAHMTIAAPAQEFLDHRYSLWNANLPSLYVPVMPGRVTVQRTLLSEMGANPQRTVDSPPDMTVSTRRVGLVPQSGGDAFDVTYDITVDAHEVPLDEVRHATLYFRHDQEVHRFPITLLRRQPAVTLDKSCDASDIALGSTTGCNITVTNTSFDPAAVALTDTLPNRLALVAGSVVGGDEAGRRTVSFGGTLYGAAPPQVTMADGTGTTPGGYLPLSLFGIAPISGVSDESMVNFSVADYVYAGETYSSIGMVSNGYAVVGGGDGADIDFVNQTLPDPTRPNNVLAPFWTDLNPSAGGALRAAYLSGGGYTWLVLDWEATPNYADGEPNSFQMWIGVNGVEDISFTYGAVSDGDGGFLTVGAENKFGNSGDNWYVDGVGTLVSAGTELRVNSIPGAPGETHVITFTAVGLGSGEWENCAEMTSDLFFGTNITCVEGIVTK